MNDLWNALASVVIAGQDFTADDVTANGTVAPDPSHAPNGAQSAIGAVFAHAKRAGWIVSADRLRPSTSPHRKGGGNRVWRPTPRGVDWAMEQMAAEHIIASRRAYPDVEIPRLFELEDTT